MRRTHVEPFQHVGVPPLPRREHCDPIHAAVEIFYRYEAVIFFKLIPAVQAGEGGMDETELEIVRCILAALADEVSFDMRCGRIHAIELRVALTREG